MNRDNMGKALYKYLSESTLLPAKARKGWESMSEEAKEEYRRIGKILAQDFIFGGRYELSLASLDEDQILYNGFFSCIFPHNHNGWCHLLLLRSRYRETEKEEYVQKMAIVTQIPGNLLAIQRQIEQIATRIMDFFKYSVYNHPQDDVVITPENTTFIEYLPYCTFNDSTDITEPPGKQKSEISIVRFQWEENKGTHRIEKNYTASNPSWQDTSVAGVNARIQSL